MATQAQSLEKDYSKYAFHDPEQYVFKSKRGLSEDIVREISKIKGEPQWMLDFRLRSLKHFMKRPMPAWGTDLSTIDFNNTSDKLGIPEAERKFLGGVGAQYDSEVIYHKIRDDLGKQGVIFLDMDSAVREHPETVKRYFGTVIPPEDNKFS